MSPAIPDDARARAALEWARHTLGRRDLELAPAASDASFRRYLALQGAPGLLLMDSPPAQVPLRPGSRSAICWLAPACGCRESRPPMPRLASP
jgi:hypothetical protein